jgi:hypothetical protein
MLNLVIVHALFSVELFARAGGGGSSSGGDGGGLAVIAMIGYAPMHLLSRFLRRKTINGEFWTASQIVGWVLCAAVCIALLFFGGIGFMVGLGAVLGMGAGLYGWFSKLKPDRKVALELKQSSNLDPAWNPEAVLERARTVFIQYQKDWSARDFEAMASYMTPEYHQHASLMVAALRQAKRINDVREPKISDILVTQVDDSADNTLDSVTVGITAKAQDVLIDEQTNAPIFTDRNEFTEFWRFARRGDTWYLADIEQESAADWEADDELRTLAKENGYFYSLDWGWLLIPRRGRLFNKAAFGTSDINNHVIGIYNNAYLLQLYTYDPVPSSPGSYLVAQTNVPKSYGEIVVRRKSWKHIFSPGGLRKVSMEWGDFNKKYNVYASDLEGATAFELLHPAFMERLEALPFEVNINVVDNVVYLYASRGTGKNPASEYRTMLDVLREAYKQMKM